MYVYGRDNLIELQEEKRMNAQAAAGNFYLLWSIVNRFLKVLLGYFLIIDATVIKPTSIEDFLTKKFAELDSKLDSVAKKSKKNGSKLSSTELRSFHRTTVSIDNLASIVSDISDTDEQFLEVQSLVLCFANTMKKKFEAGHIDEVEFVQPEVFALFDSIFIKILDPKYAQHL